MTERMNLLTLELLELPLDYVVKDFQAIIARQLSGNVGVLTETELRAAAIDDIAKKTQAYIGRMGGASISRIYSVENSNGVPRRSLICMLSNGFGFVMPYKARERL